MGCCCGDEEDQRQDVAQQQRPRIRGCTDVFWLFLFVLFWILLILIAAFAFVYGNPVRLVNGYDSFGNTCGVDNNQKFGNDSQLTGQDTSDKKYLFFMDMTNIKKSLKICVKKCPDRRLDNMTDVCRFFRETGSELCHADKFADSCREIEKRVMYNNYKVVGQFGTCANIKFPVFESTDLLHRCIPKALTETTTTLASNLYGWLNSWDTIEQILADLYKTWREILALSFLAFVFSLLMIAIFHLLANIVTWIVVILVIIACSTGTGLLWWTYFDIKKQLDNTNSRTLLDESVRNEKFFQVLAIVATIITSILFIVLCLVRKKVSFMAELFKESAKCLAELPGLFFTPPLTFAALLVFFTYWITVIVCLATANIPTTKMTEREAVPINSLVDERAMPRDLTLSNISVGAVFEQVWTVVDYADASWVKYMWWVYIIGLIWVSEFITSCQTMVISGAVVHWYFEKHKTPFPVCSSIKKLIFYHLGSVACGSLLITIFKLPRLILTYIKEKFRLQTGNSESARCAICGMNACSCCLYCLERFIQFMSNNAYTVIAIEGCNFCTAAERAFSTITSNALQVAVINGIGDFILFLGKCIVTAATGSVALLFLRSDPMLHFYAVPVFVISVFAFFIAHCVISLYESIIDTLFLCICEDKYLYGDNGKWKNSPLAKLGEAANSNGQHEMSPMNK